LAKVQRASPANAVVMILIISSSGM